MNQVLVYIKEIIKDSSADVARALCVGAALTDPPCPSFPPSLPPSLPLPATLARASPQARARASGGNGTPPHSAARELPPVRRCPRRSAPRRPTDRVRRGSRRGTVERESAAPRVERQRRGGDPVFAPLATPATHVGRRRWLPRARARRGGCVRAARCSVSTRVYCGTLCAGRVNSPRCAHKEPRRAAPTKRERRRRSAGIER